MPRIFISYRRAVSAYQAGRIFDRLVQAFGEENVFLDVDGIPAGENFDTYILQRIQQSDVFLALLSKGTLDRINEPGDWVRQEIAYALSLPQVRVIPVLVDNFEMPKPGDLPLDIQGITRKNAAKLDHTLFNETASRLIQRIKKADTGLKMHPPQSTVPTEKTTITPTPAAGGRVPLIGIIGAAAVLLLIGVLFVLPALTLPANPGPATPTATSGEIAGAASPTATDAMPTDPATETATAEPSATDMPTDEPTATDTLTDAPTDEPILTSTPTATATDRPTATHTPTPTASSTPTDTSTSTLTPSLTSTVDIQAAAQTVVAIQTAERIVTEATATAAQATLDQVLTETESVIQTATATAWTATPTFDLTLTIAAVLTDWQHQTETQVAADSTATADAWTDTPTPDLNASADAPETHRAATATADAWTDTPTPTYSPTFTPMELAMQRAEDGVTRNSDWTPVEQDFDGVTMVLVPKGCFMMGSMDGNTNEQPVAQQCIEEPFWLDKYEVSNGQFEVFNGVAGQRALWSEYDLPRGSIAWHESENFCSTRGGRLPTEKEWEYAARGPDGLVYPWGNDFIGDYVVANSGDKTASVGSRPKGMSWVGALDLAGNVQEWTGTMYGKDDGDFNFTEPGERRYEYPYDPEDGRELEVMLRTYLRVLRGGDIFGDINFDSRTTYRDWANPFSAYPWLGFRCARSYDAGG